MTNIVQLSSDLLPFFKGDPGEAGGVGDAGNDGASAYELAVAGGFVGSEAAWLLSLKGETGDVGDAGNDGASAYEIAVAGGFVGSEAAWLLSLKGETGDAGPAGTANEVSDWASLIALSGVPDGRSYTVLAPLITGGVPGTSWKRDSGSPSGWRPAGRQVIYLSRTEVVGVTTTNEQIQRTLAIPGGVLPGCLMMVATARTSWSAADGASRSARFRLGAEGSVADAQIGVHQTVLSTHRQSLHAQAYVPDSPTLLSQWQMVNIQTTSWVGQTSGTNALLFDSYAVDSMDSTIYLSATQQQAGSPTAVPTLEFFSLEVA
jgi:hypothetical protein